jgi:hypothetical protein
VPWCPECDRFYNPNTLLADGTCPSGHVVPDERAVATAEAPAEGKPEKIGRFRDEPTPWHFKVLLVLVSIYLLFRLVQGIMWVAGL